MLFQGGQEASAWPMGFRRLRARGLASHGLDAPLWCHNLLDDSTACPVFALPGWSRDHSTSSVGRSPSSQLTKTLPLEKLRVDLVEFSRLEASPAGSVDFLSEPLLLAAGPAIEYHGDVHEQQK